ncbi:MAG: MarR family transcriptional regulator [Hamadaea sp.]|uniref:MarR family winged helix-turn-helix transcriptional regulator n=1 Tax=Hamadaea sp. TaxID=2024425 RepID=UPI001807EF61|nr:MarR family transcriptional regulator [Hamadaea sp.]NUR71679.1 MarR family transcriptional regulator [Hamadaea sp.]NUT18171.1 MarR family transcriptional regulator [Hamadaea sp.]
MEKPPTLLGIDAYLLSQIGKAGRNRVADRLAARGLRLWHFAVLAALADFGPHSQRDLSVRLTVDVSDMAKVLDQLTADDRIDRVRDSADRRRMLVSLTDQGRELLEELRRDAAEVDRELLSALTAAERKQLHALLLKVSRT